MTSACDADAYREITFGVTPFNKFDMSDLPLAGKESGIKTMDFSFMVADNAQVLGSVMIMHESCFIWLGSEQGSCNMSSLSAAMPTRFSGIPISTVLLNDESDLSSDMSKRLALRFKIQVFVSCNIPQSFEAQMHLIDKELIGVLSEHF